MGNNWYEQLNTLHKELNQNAEVSIIDEEVTGTKGTSEAPDNLFYSEFREEDAKAFIDIFTKFKETYSLNKRLAIDNLSVNLYEQIGCLPKNICPIELILYSSRTIKEQIKEDKRVFKLLKGIITKNIGINAQKIIWYIMTGWDWKTQLSIMVEALGDNNDKTLINQAMIYYDNIAKLCIEDNDKSVLKSYLNMLLATQNTEFIESIVDVVTNPYYMEEPNLVDYFIDNLKCSEFLQKEPAFSNILRQLNNRNLISTFRILISRLHPKGGPKDNRIATTINSSLDQNYKEDAIATLKFGGNSNKDLKVCEKVRNADGCILVCKKIMENIDNIPSDEVKGNAYALLGTKGRSCRAKVITFLQDQKTSNSMKYIVPINIALLALNEISPKVLFDSIIDAHYKIFWAKNLGKYFRYDKDTLAREMLPYLSTLFIENPGDEDLMVKVLAMLNDMLKAFDYDHTKLSDLTLGLPDKFVEILYSLGTKFVDRDVYDKILDLLEFIGKACPFKQTLILQYLDVLKKDLSKSSSLLSIEVRINKLIEEYDTPVLPNV